MVLLGPLAGALAKARERPVGAAAVAERLDQLVHVDTELFRKRAAFEVGAHARPQICPAPSVPTWSTCLLKDAIAGRALSDRGIVAGQVGNDLAVKSIGSWPSTSGTSTMPIPLGAARFLDVAAGLGRKGRCDADH